MIKTATQQESLETERGPVAPMDQSVIWSFSSAVYDQIGGLTEGR